MYTLIGVRKNNVVTKIGPKSIWKSTRLKNCRKVDLAASFDGPEGAKNK
jgi:hypothetical protein